ncbi:M48 family metallopeptidase [uncultured Methanoregula sp.]|uniref:M48 metallopeptidase family protein n=1 Tax=uncultured Methanoregula sp. TaxID=1005933 RepID=UPI003747B283
MKHPRLEFRTGTLLVVLPNGQNEDRILEKHRRWIQRKYQFIQEVIDTSATITLESRTKEEFRKQVQELIARYSKDLGCSPNRVIIKIMRTKWASCSRKGNLTINSLGQYLPDDLVEYIVYHEMVHLTNPNHNSLFWMYIHKNFKDTTEIEKSLCSYWFQVQK